MVSVCVCVNCTNQYIYRQRYELLSGNNQILLLCVCSNFKVNILIGMLLVHIFKVSICRKTASHIYGKASMLYVFFLHEYQKCTFSCVLQCLLFGRHPVFSRCHPKIHINISNQNCAPGAIDLLDFIQPRKTFCPQNITKRSPRYSCARYILCFWIKYKL